MNKAFLRTCISLPLCNWYCGGQWFRSHSRHKIYQKTKPFDGSTSWKPYFNMTVHTIKTWIGKLQHHDFKQFYWVYYKKWNLFRINKLFTGMNDICQIFIFNMSNFLQINNYDTKIPPKDNLTFRFKQIHQLVLVFSLLKIISGENIFRKSNISYSLIHTRGHLSEQFY